MNTFNRSRFCSPFSPARFDRFDFRFFFSSICYAWGTESAAERLGRSALIAQMDKEMWETDANEAITFHIGKMEAVCLCRHVVSFTPGRWLAFFLLFFFFPSSLLCSG